MSWGLLVKHVKFGVAFVACLLLLAGGVPALADSPYVPMQLSSPGADHGRQPRMITSPDGTLLTGWWETSGSTYSVRLSTSSDRGVTWSLPTNVSGNHSSGGFQSPSLAASPNGTLAALWPKTTTSTSVEMQVSTSTDQGATWSTPQDLASYAGTWLNSWEIMAVNSDALVAAWVAREGSDYFAETRRSDDGGASWGPVERLSVPGEEPVGIVLEQTSDGTIVASWHASGLPTSATHVVRVSSSTDHGATWTDPVTVADRPESAGGVKLAAGLDGSLVAAWHVRVAPNEYYVEASRSIDGGLTWLPVSTLSPAAISTPRPVIASHGATIIVTWPHREASYASGHHSIEMVRSTDGGVSWSDPSQLAPPQPSPYITDLVAAADGSLTMIGSMENAQGSRVIQTLTSFNEGATWSPPTQVSPSAHSVGNSRIAATADGDFIAVWEGRVQPGPMSIHTAHVPVSPLITSTPPVDPTIDESYEFTVTATGKPAPTFAISSGSLPAGLSMSSDGVISGTATGSGTSTFTVVASNGANPPASKTYTMTVQQAPVITSAAPPAAKAGEVYLFTVTASGYPASAFSVSSGTLPTGLSLGSDGVISGTPTESGDFTFTVVASNGVDPDASRSYTVTVVEAPVITSGAPSTPTVGEGYSFAVTASGSPAPTFAVGSGALPTGLSLGSDGVISGTPTESGDFTFTVVASNGVDPDASRSYTVSPFHAPVITSSTPPAPTVGARYSFQIVATANPAPTFVVASGTLPAGLSLSDEGLLFGTATGVGDWEFTVEVSNGIGDDASATYSLSTLADPNGLASTGSGSALPAAIAGGVVLLLGTMLTLIARSRRTDV